ncbi:unnamed protein product, partial [Callosobruchus maculatus]
MMLDAIVDLLGCSSGGTVRKTSATSWFKGNNNASITIAAKEGLASRAQWRGNRTISTGSTGGTGGAGGNAGGDGGRCNGGTPQDGGEAGPKGADQLEGAGSAQNDSLHLKRRVGLVSGVALIVGTMIG